MQIEVLNIQGQKTGRQVELPEDIFNYEQPNDHAIYLAVKAYNAAQRQGTAKVKGRSEVHGSSKKLHRQKGTGGSRKGNIRNPLYKGGGTVHGPQLRDYTMKINKKVKELAKISAFTYKTRENELLVIEDIKIDTPNTKAIVETVKALGKYDNKVLFINSEYDQDFYLSTRNIPNVHVVEWRNLNIYELLNADTVVFSESLAKLFTEVLQEA